MKKFLRFIYIQLIVLSVFAEASAQRETPPAGGTPKDFVLPSKKQSVLPNGMRSTLVQFGQLPKVNIRLIIKTGNVHETANEVWLADLLAKLMEEGTTSASAQEVARKAAGMGGEVKVSAGSDQFTISGSALSQFAPELLKLIADIALHPAFPEKELGRLKADLKRNIAVNKGVPQSIAREKLSQAIFGAQSPYSRIYPSEEQVDGYTLDQVKKFYTDQLGAKRSVLYVAGKFDEGSITKSIDALFASWKAGPEPIYSQSKNTYEPVTMIVDRKGAPQTTVFMGLPSINPGDPDYLALSITNSLLGGSFGSRITSNIREQKGYTYSPNSGFMIHPGSAAWYEEADVTSEHTIDAVREIKKEIERLGTEPPSAKELDGIKRYNAGLFVLQNSTPSGIIGQLNLLDLYGLDDSYLTNRVKNIYAVTPEQITALTKKYIVPEKMSIIMVGDEQSIKAQQAR